MNGDLGRSNTEKHCEFNKNIAKDVGHLHTGKNPRVSYRVLPVQKKQETLLSKTIYLMN